jgi:hypothetical protein
MASTNVDTMNRIAAVLADAIEYLRGCLRPGDTVYTLLRHESRLLGIWPSGTCSVSTLVCRDGKIVDISSTVAFVLGQKTDLQHGGIKWSSNSDASHQDLGFNIAHRISQTLYSDGFPCLGKDCPSKGHVYDSCEDASDGWHRAGGYALRYEWI